MAPDSPVTNQPPAWNASTPDNLNLPESGGSYNFKPHAVDPHIWDSVEISSKFALPAGYSLADGVLVVSAGAASSPVTLVATDSEGLESEHGCNVIVAATGDVVADWEWRSQGPGVFWATSFTGGQWVRGVPGHTSQPIGAFPTGQLGRIVTDILSDAEVPAGEGGTLAPDKFLGDLGDGKGIIALKPHPSVAGSMMWLRPRSLYQGAGGSSDYNVMPWAWAPLDWADIEDGTGQPNERLGIPGTWGEGKILPFVETGIAYDPVTGAPVASSYNSSNRPMLRHLYVQYRINIPWSWNWYRPVTWNDTWVTPVGRNVRATKHFFLNGGNGPGQVAFGISGNLGILRAVYQDAAGSFRSGSREISTGTGVFEFVHSAIDIPSAPAPVYGAGVEGYMRKYGPSGKSMEYGEGMRVNGVAISPDANWYPPEDARIGGVGNYVMGNTVTNPVRNYPYGGYPTDGSVPLPEMGWGIEATAGIIRPGRTHTVEILYSQQVSATEGSPGSPPAYAHVNRDQRIASWKTPKPGPSFVAVWAAPEGEEPVLLWSTLTADDKYPGLIPSKALHRYGGNFVSINGDNATSFESQDNSTREDKANCGFMVLGSYDGFPDPTDKVFYAMRANPPGKLKGICVEDSSKSVDPGTCQGFGSYQTIGWAIGDLLSLPGDDVSPYTRQSGWQFVVEKTELERVSYTTQNAYDNGLSSVTAPVHKYTMLRTLPAVPRARSASYTGDCFNQGFCFDAIRILGNEIGFAEIIFSLKEIPFPGYPSKKLPMPWRS